MNWLKVYLPMYFILYLLIVFVLPSYRTYKSTGIYPVTFGKSGNAHDYAGFVMKVLIAMLLIAILVFSFSEKWYQYLSPIQYLQTNFLRITGIILIHISLLWTSIAQFQMGNSWRIGIDTKNKTELVTDGIFSLSRNPIFLGMIISVTGIFFIIPNTLTFFVALTTYFIIQIQIRMEEEFLTGLHAEKYLQYKQKTNRFI